jgi:hypothetical protein
MAGVDIIYTLRAETGDCSSAIFPF